MKKRARWLTSLKIWLGLVIFSLPTTSLAHVKWFAEEKNEPVRPYQLTDVPILIWIVASLAMVSLGVFLERNLKLPQNISEKLKRLKPTVISLATIGFGIALLIFSFNNYIFSPNLVTVGQFGFILLLIHAVVGLLLVLGLNVRIASLFIIGLFGLSLVNFGWGAVDSLEILGLGTYILITGRPKWRIAESQYLANAFENYQKLALPLLRITLGINLITLGFDEKILAPALALNFLNGHDWNFMAKLGMAGFTDYWFAFSAGASEILIGVFLVLGLVTRLTIIALATFLVITLFLLGPIELIGHLPHFAIASILLVAGSGQFKLK